MKKTKKVTSLNELPSQKGKIAIVTGANIGIGYETTLGLVKKDAKVIMACRNIEKAAKAKINIEKEVPGADIEIILLDLSSLQSVKDFAKTFSDKYQQLDLLINNAGVMVPPFSKTIDGFESQMGVNYFGHFLITNLMLPLLKATTGSRIVTLSSISYKRGRIDFDNLNSEKSHSKNGAYGQSKLACLMFAYELQRRLEQSGSNVISVAAHPGLSETNIIQHFPKIITIIFTPIASFFMQSAKNGALPILLAATGNEVKGGEYYGPIGFNEMNGNPGKVLSLPHSHDKEIAKKLWEVSEDLIGVKFDF